MSEGTTLGTNKYKKSLLAFVHIEKAAGTTLNHLLRANFPLTHYDVRPFSKKSEHIFGSRDLSIALKLNPYLRSISGHSIRPYVNFGKDIADIRFIGIFREPSRRYLSQYRYWRDRLQIDIDFKRFLSLEHHWNLQTTKIAGQLSLNRAKDILKNNFFLLGIVEEFDDFLDMLKKKILPVPFHTNYTRKNVKNDRSEYDDLLHRYEKEIAERNDLDFELYHFIINELIPSQKSALANKISPISYPKIENINWHMARYANYFYRKIYIDPVTKFIRKRNGLSIKGSY